MANDLEPALQQHQTEILVKNFESMLHVQQHQQNDHEDNISASTSEAAGDQEEEQLPSLLSSQQQQATLLSSQQQQATLGPGPTVLYYSTCAYIERDLCILKDCFCS